MVGSSPAGPVHYTYSPARMIKPGNVTPPLPRAQTHAVRTARGVQPTPTQVARKTGFTAWLGAHKVLASVITMVLVTASVAIAAVVWSQSFSATPNTRTSPVTFAAGTDATTLATLGFIDAPVIGASGATASITLYGIPGASSLSLGKVLKVQNPDTSDNTDYAVTLSVSGSPAVTLTAFTVTFVDDIDGTVTWNLLTTPSLSAHTLNDAETWDITVSSLVESAAASGSQGALTISASITPA